VRIAEDWDWTRPLREVRGHLPQIADRQGDDALRSGWRAREVDPLRYAGNRDFDAARPIRTHLYDTRVNRI
jgi:hypothetical protein